MKNIKRWFILCVYFGFLTSFSQKCGVTHFNYEKDSLNVDQYTFFSNCSEPCFILEKKQNGIVFFCPGASVGKKLKKMVDNHKKNQIEKCFFEAVEVKVPVAGVKILFEVDPKKHFLLSRTFISVSGQQGLLIRCIENTILRTLHIETSSNIRRYAYYNKD